MATVGRHHHFLTLVLVLTLFPRSLSQPPPTAALLQLRRSISKSDSLMNWNNDGSNPCDPSNVWVGVVCTNGMVTSINLASMGLEGRPDIGALEVIDGLKGISVENNSLFGQLPEINRLRHLKTFYGSKNQFSGQIPGDFFQPLGTLKKLWLSNNRFSGPIPKSLGDLSNLKELHLEYNEFSGPIPEFPEADVIITLDLSNNKLEGEIPSSMDKFDKKVFANNTGLCGPKLSKECRLGPGQAPPMAPAANESNTAAKWTILGIVITLFLITILVKAKQKEEPVKTTGKEPPDEAVHVNIPATTKTTTSSDRKDYHDNFAGSLASNLTGNLASTLTGKDKTDSLTRSSRKGGSQQGKLASDLVVVNNEKGVFGLQDLMKAAAEVLGNGGLGSAYKAMMGNGVSVVVKRVREMNKMTKEMFDAEMRKLANLKHPNILTPLAYHFRKEEKLLVSEYVSKGSLLYVLHGDRGTSHAELTWPIRLKIIKGVARGMDFLHTEFATYDLPHGNLKSSNVLLGQDYEPLLTDYALHPLVNNTPTAQSMFAYKSPEGVLSQRVCHKSDVYCLGIVILEIVTGKYPSQYFQNQKGGTDVVQWVHSALAENREMELIDPEITEGAKESMGQMEAVLHIGAACTESELDRRLSMNEAIKRIEEV